MITVNTRIENEVCIIEVIGEVDASSSISLDEELGKAVSLHPRIIVNLGGLEYISSAGLGVFMSYIQDLEIKNAKMILCEMKDKVLQVFKILGLDQLFQIANTQEDAIKKLNEI